MYAIFVKDLKINLIQIKYIKVKQIPYSFYKDYTNNIILPENINLNIQSTCLFTEDNNQQ